MSCIEIDIYISFGLYEAVIIYKIQIISQMLRFFFISVLICLAASSCSYSPSIPGIQISTIASQHRSCDSGIGPFEHSSVLLPAICNGNADDPVGHGYSSKRFRFTSSPVERHIEMVTGGRKVGRPADPRIYHCWQVVEDRGCCLAHRYSLDHCRDGHY